MFTSIEEPVQVETFFSAGGVTPRWFIWNGRRIEVKEVTQAWEERAGGRKTYHFAVYDGQSVFSLLLSPAGLSWMLSGVSDGL